MKMKTGFGCFLLLLLSQAFSLNPIRLTADDAPKLIKSSADRQVDTAWKISTRDSSKKVKINVLSLPSDSSCDAFLDVYDGPDKNAELLGHYCNGSPTLTSKGNALFVRFVAKAALEKVLNVEYFQTEENGGLSGGAIAGIIISIVVIGAIGGIGGCVCCKRFNMCCNINIFKN